MTTQINQLTELTTTSDGDLLLIRESATGVDKKIQSQNLRAKATTKDDVGLGNVPNLDTTDAVAGNFSSVDIDGGNIDGTPIGVSSASSGAFTTLDASGDVNFDSGTLFVDASANRVGIGTTSPAYPLDVDGTVQIGLGTTGLLRFKASAFGQIISPTRIITDSDTHDFRSGSGSDYMRIDSSGNVGIGTTSPSVKLDVNGSIKLTDKIYTDTGAEYFVGGGTIKSVAIGNACCLLSVWMVTASDSQNDPGLYLISRKGTSTKVITISAAGGVTVSVNASYEIEMTSSSTGTVGFNLLKTIFDI